MHNYDTEKQPKVTCKLQIWWAEPWRQMSLSRAVESEPFFHFFNLFPHFLFDGLYHLHKVVFKDASYLLGWSGVAHVEPQTRVVSYLSFCCWMCSYTVIFPSLLPVGPSGVSPYFGQYGSKILFLWVPASPIHPCLSWWVHVGLRHSLSPWVELGLSLWCWQTLDGLACWGWFNCMQSPNQETPKSASGEHVRDRTRPTSPPCLEGELALQCWLTLDGLVCWCMYTHVQCTGRASGSLSRDRPMLTSSRG